LFVWFADARKSSLVYDDIPLESTPVYHRELKRETF